MPLVETSQNGPVTTITLADEARRNVLSHQLVDELIGAIDLAEDTLEVRVVIVTNRGRVFCAGADLSSAPYDPSTSTGERRTDLSELLQRIRLSPKPFVGKIAGHCVAGGVGLAAVMDISVAVESATFGFSEVRVGVAPAMISVVCLAKMRLADAQAAFLRGNRFSAAQAARMGLINDVASSDAMDVEIDAIVNDLLAGEPHAIAATKQLVATVPSLGTEEAFAWTTQLSATLFASEQAREGMTSFLEKRPASWVVRAAPSQSA